MSYVLPISLSGPRLFGWAAFLLLFSTSALAQADVGLRLAPHAGVAVSDDVDPSVGLGARLTASSSPLTLEPKLDYVFDENQTLYHVSCNLSYELPVDFRLKPYFGLGANFSSFRLERESMTVDSEGNRLGLNLFAGARLELPWLSPFVQVTKTIGEIDPLALSGGVELTLRKQSEQPSAPTPMRFAATPYLANNVIGDVQSGRVGLGLSVAIFPWKYFGFELDGELHGHFFRDEDVAGLVEEGVDLNTNAALLSTAGVVRYCVGGNSYGTTCPYATAGIGAIHAWFDGIAHAPGTSSSSSAQTDAAWTAGLGISHSFTRNVGLRVDGRYFRALVDENAPNGGYFEDYGFLRLSTGVSVGF